MRKTVLANSLLFLFVAASFFFLWPVQKAVVFYYKNTEDLIAFLPVKSGDTFQIIFTHSIHLTDVVEKYRVLEDGQIEQYEFVYEEYGIGMPANAEPGQQFLYEDGKFYIKNMNLRFPYMNVRNGKTVSKHRLAWDDNGEKMIWFNEYFNPGDWYTVKVENLPRWKTLKGVKIKADG